MCSHILCSLLNIYDRSFTGDQGITVGSAIELQIRRIANSSELSKHLVVFLWIGAVLLHWKTTMWSKSIMKYLCTGNF